MSFNKKLPDPHELKGLRQRAKIDLNDLATQTGLTTAQLTQLEQGGRHLFYSEEIRKQAIYRILKVIDPANSYFVNETDSTGTKVSNPSQQNSHLSNEKNVIEDIVRLSAKSRSPFNYLPSSPYSRKNLSPMAWGAICVMFGIALLYWSPWEIENLFLIPGLTSTPSTPSTPSTTASTLTSPQSENSKSISSEEKVTSNAAQSNVAELSSLNANPTPNLGSNASEISAAQTKSAQNQAATSATADSQNKPLTALTSSSPSQISSSVIGTSPIANSSTSSTSSPATTPSLSANSVTKISTELTTDPCQLLGSDAPIAPLAAYPSKAGNYVYMNSTDITQACVQDATGKKSIVRFQKDQGTSIYGKAPWQIAGPDIQKIQIYFQGARINTSAISGQRILLVEQNIAQ